MAKRYYISIKAVIRDGGKVLLVQKPDGRWDLPGGRMEPEETPQESLIRETFEEIGVMIAVGGLINCGARARPKDPGVFVAVYLSEMDFALKDIRLSHEHVKAKLFTPKEAKDLKMEKVYKQAIARAFKKP